MLQLSRKEKEACCFDIRKFGTLGSAMEISSSHTQTLFYFYHMNSFIHHPSPAFVILLFAVPSQQPQQQFQPAQSFHPQPPLQATTNLQQNGGGNGSNDTTMLMNQLLASLMQQPQSGNQVVMASQPLSSGRNNNGFSSSFPLQQQQQPQQHEGKNTAKRSRQKRKTAILAHNDSVFFAWNLGGQSGHILLADCACLNLFFRVLQMSTVTNVDLHALLASLAPLLAAGNASSQQQPQQGASAAAAASTNASFASSSVATNNTDRATTIPPSATYDYMHNIDDPGPHGKLLLGFQLLQYIYIYIYIYIGVLNLYQTFP